MVAQKFFVLFFVAKKFEKDYDIFFRIALSICSCVSLARGSKLLLTNIDGNCLVYAPAAAAPPSGLTFMLIFVFPRFLEQRFW
jgi:hypothetical protein